MAFDEVTTAHVSEARWSGLELILHFVNWMMGEAERPTVTLSALLPAFVSFVRMTKKPLVFGGSDSIFQCMTTGLL